MPATWAAGVCRGRVPAADVRDRLRINPGVREMADAGEDLVARGLEAVGAHQRAATRAAMHHSETAEALTGLLMNGLRRVYAAHREAVTRLPERAGQAGAPDLKAAFVRAAAENDAQLERLERVFRVTSFSVEGTPDQTLTAIVDDARAAAAAAGPGMARDQLLIAGEQLVAHYYLALYGTLRAWARTLDNGDAAGLLGETLGEVSRADEALTALAQHLVAAA